MSTTPLTDAINALTTYSNTVTGASDTTLSEAVATLASGYGGGGSDNLPKLAMGTVTDADVDWSQITELRENAFDACRLLTTVGNPTISNFPSGGFRYCSGLTSAEITATASIQTYCDNMFRYCTSLQTATMNIAYTGNGNVTFGANYTFSGCTNLHTVILTRASATYSITLNANWMFYGSSALRNLVLKCPVMVTLNNGNGSNAWGGMWDNPTESKIYVPQALISQYQQANNWVNLYNQGISFVKIEGSIYE